MKISTEKMKIIKNPSAHTRTEMKISLGGLTS